MLYTCCVSHTCLTGARARSHTHTHTHTHTPWPSSCQHVAWQSAAACRSPTPPRPHPLARATLILASSLIVASERVSRPRIHPPLPLRLVQLLAPSIRHQRKQCIPIRNTTSHEAQSSGQARGICGQTTMAGNTFDSGQALEWFQETGHSFIENARRLKPVAI